jgi:hypothetical protein
MDRHSTGEPLHGAINMATNAVLNLSLPPETLDRVDQFRRDFANPPSRQAALRMLTEEGLNAIGKERGCQQDCDSANPR